ncbi:MAG: UPF0175 family protein [Acidobacteriota bacterium]
MLNQRLNVELPTGLAVDEAKTLLAVKLYEEERISLGQAAKMSGFSKRAFMEILGQHRIPIFRYSPEDLRNELGM